MELILDFSTGTSDRNAAKRLNRIRLEDCGIIPTTYRNTVEREGQRIQERIEQKCEEALVHNGFSADGTLPEETPFTYDEPKSIDTQTIAAAAAELNISGVNPSDYESPDETVNISLDDVCVKRQTKTRPKDETVQQLKRVNNTVIHVQHKKRGYILNGATVLGALKLLIGFLLLNSLLRKQLVLFTDGARDLHSAISKMLKFANVKIILDWYHLEKKCKEQLSMALRGSKIRNTFLSKLMPCLWFGNVSGAILLLNNIDPEKVKSHEIITKLIEYLERVRGCIPCYALRKKLGLRNSSNKGEKSNDLVVSSRQKHNGMSWSNDGSFSFATISATSCNNEIPRWVNSHDIGFCLLSCAE